MNCKTCIIQWNIRGMLNKKKEIIHLIQKCKASVVALQETQIPLNRMYKIPKFNSIAKIGTVNRRNHGGVALYIHESIPYSEVTISTQLQAVAATVHLGSKFTICNVYNSRSHDLTLNSLLQLYNQLPKPCIIVGVFNAYSRVWGCRDADSRGRILENFIEQADLVVLNNGSPTHPNSEVDSAIDLSLCNPELSEVFEWNTLSSVFDSDHFPILLSTHFLEPEPTPIQMLKKANWNIYAQSSAWSNLPQQEISCEQMLEDLYSRIAQACQEAIPTTTPSKFFPKPFWSPELSRTRAVREILYQQYRHNRTQENRIRWSKARAEHKYKVNMHKKIKKIGNNSSLILTVTCLSPLSAKGCGS